MYYIAHYKLSGKYEILIQYWFIVGSLSETLAQNQTNSGQTFLLDYILTQDIKPIMV